MLADADRRLGEEGIAGGISASKSRADPAGNSFGCQENYLVGGRARFGRLTDILIPFLVTRQIICGAGAVVPTPRGAVYCLGRRGRGLYYGLQRSDAVDRTARDIEIFAAKTVVPPVPWRYRQAG